MKKSANQLQLDIDSYLGRSSPGWGAESGIIADVLAHEPAPTPTRQLDAEIKAAIADPIPDPARVAAFREKREAKRDRLEAAAARAKRESSARLTAAHRLGDAIPFGQPILVGHHSEKRHRRDIERIDQNMRKGFEASDRAAELASRAASIGSGGVSSDDPEAVQKLRRELAPLVERQTKMKQANALIRKHAKAGTPAQVAALVAFGYPQSIATKLLEKDFAGRIGFADYEITNNGANIRRIEKRIAELLAKESAPVRADIIGTTPDGVAFTISENRDINRCQIVFAGGKPPDALRAKLKSAGFKWAPTEGAWQRQASNGAWYHAKSALGVP